jgi:hypothetical protein
MRQAGLALALLLTLTQHAEAARGSVTLALATPGAHVVLVSSTDRREVPIFPIRINLDTSQSWTIEATKPGYRTYHQRIDFSDGVLDKTIKIELVR